MGYEPSSGVGGVGDRDSKSYQQEVEGGTSVDAEYSASLRLRGEKNLFWRFSLCNVCRLWQPHADALHLLHLGILKTMTN